VTVEKLGSYTILRKLGEGGMGAVYAGVHEAIGRKAAIKMLHANLAADPAILARFFNERAPSTSSPIPASSRSTITVSSPTAPRIS
jgi:serine/threonine protein kinase